VGIHFLRKFVGFFLTLHLKILRVLRLKVLFEADIIKGWCVYCINHKVPICYDQQLCKSILKLQKILRICLRSFVNSHPVPIFTCANIELSIITRGTFIFGRGKPAVNFINVKCTNFTYESLFSSYVLALNKLSYKNVWEIENWHLYYMRLKTNDFKVTRLVNLIYCFVLLFKVKSIIWTIRGYMNVL